MKGVETVMRDDVSRGSGRKALIPISHAPGAFRPSFGFATQLAAERIVISGLSSLRVTGYVEMT